MRLSKLEIYGFKSFAKRTEIIFPQNVTGIVGPNGSGKSNISDAVRWVLGEQSAKVLRGNNMADVIFNGTEAKKPMNYCEVALVFDNTDKQLPVEFAEVSITRRVYRSGDSEYLMNGSACRLKDIVDLFRDTGVGKEGYSIIGQGRIDEILSQRGEDRRAIFEEAAGISRFRQRKEEAEQRLKRADENLLRVVDVVEELQNHMGPLERQATVAKEFLALEGQLKELDVQLYLLRHDRLRAREASVEQTLLSIQDLLVELNKQAADTSAQRDAAQEALEAVQQALRAAHDGLLETNEAHHLAREAASQVENRLNQGTDTAQRLQTEAEAVRNRLALIQATMTHSGDGIEAANALKNEAEALLQQQKEAYTAATDSAQKWEDELSAHKSAIIDRMNRIQDVKTTQARQTTMHTQMSARKQELEGELAQGTEKGERLAAALKQAKANLVQEKDRYEGLKAEAEAFELSTKQMLADILEKQKALQEAAQSARGLDTRLKTLKELQDGYEGYQYSVKNALQYAKQRHLPGIHDVIAMLLTVPKELETAIDMALGGAMQNIVTDTEQDAKLIIDHLRQNHLGRATFLPLSTVRGRTLSGRERDVLSMPGCLGVASELCQFAGQYRPIMESLLGRTVVAKDLDSGIAIMRAGGHAFRLVTLTGDVMHSGGSMTGGSIQQKAQNLLGREREIRELEETLKEKTLLIAQEQEALTALEGSRAGSKEKREAAQYALHQQEIAVVRDTEREAAAQQELDQHSAATEGLNQAIEQLTESLEDIQRELDRAQLKSQEDSHTGEEMNARTEELSAILDKARRERETAQEAQTAAMLRLKEAEHDLDRIQRDQKRLLGDSETCRVELQTLGVKRQQCLEDIKQAEDQRQEAAEKVNACEKAVTASKAHVDEMEAKQRLAQQQVKDLQGEIEAGQLLLTKESERLHRQEMAQARVKAELAQLDDRLWDTYELTYAGAEQARDEYLARAAEAADLAEAEALTRAAAHAPAGADAEALAAGWSTAGEQPALGETLSQKKPAFDETAAEQEAQGLRERIRAMGTVHVGAIEEFAQLHQRYTELTTQQQDLQRAKTDLEALIEKLLQQMETVFVGQFNLLQKYFSETFSRLFGGGQGEIQLSDPNDPLNCGIEIIVQPPGKKRQLLSLFSGGERALTAIAILFAMLMLKPTPFCILDEIEAALDEANIGYFADYLKEFSKDTQFVVVTHRKGTMERCDTLFGVAMEERGVSSLVSVNLTDYE